MLKTTPHIDTAIGLKYLMGNPSSYCSMLAIFAETHRHTARQLQETLAAGDRASAERMAHTLKGIAATLGMQELREIAARIEHDIHAGITSEEGVRHCQSLAEALSAAIEEIGDIVAAGNEAVQAESNGLKIDEVLGLLEQSLIADDAKAYSLWHEHHARFSEGLGADSAATLGKYIENFDFPDALACLYTILDERK